jgi:monovalent cation:H+ antiporter-2, CPA2 family
VPHHTPLIGTIVAALVAAFLMGALAHRLRVSPIAGYLFAGVLVGPFTPGFVADAGLAAELAEIGVILLMFGVGLHFSFRDLLWPCWSRRSRWRWQKASASVRALS